MKKMKLMMTGAAGTLALLAGGIAIAQVDGGPAKHGPRDVMADADKDGNVTRAEMTAGVQARFAAMDVNRDGKVSAEDRAMKREQRQDAWFAKVDADKNGQISKPELSAARDARRAERQQRREAWKAGHPDGAKHEGRGFGRHRHDGHFGKGRHGGFGRGGGMMGADADRDGAITQSEMLAAATARFDRMDTDRNGTVTPAERQAARAAKKAEWKAKRQTAQPAPAAD